MMDCPGGCSCDHCGVIFVGLESEDGECKTCRAINDAWRRATASQYINVTVTTLRESFEVGYRAALTAAKSDSA